MKTVTVTTDGDAGATISLKDARAGLAAYLKTFPDGEFERNRAPSRDLDIKVFSMLPPKPEEAAGSP